MTTTVLYIGGLGRSGSTLFARMLGELDGFFSAGELRDLWRRGVVENRLCGCGEPFRSCPFWDAVAEEAFGGWDAVDFAAILAVWEAVDRHRFVPLLLAPRLPRGFGRKVDELLKPLGALYRAIAVVSGAAVIVDSSKAPSYAALLRRMPAIDLRVLHLVRDGRGTAFSWNKQVERSDYVQGSQHMVSYRPWRVAVRWVVLNGFVEGIGSRGTPRAFLRYEDLIADPRAAVNRAATLAGHPATARDLAFVGDREVSLSASHNVQGNPNRMTTGAIPLRLDEQWRQHMTTRHRRAVTAITWPMLKRYGYR